MAASSKPLSLVVLAAGEGTRLWPITETIPKTMVRVLDKPLVAWSVESALDWHPNLEQIVIVIGHHAKSIREYFQTKPYAKKITFVEQKERLGTAHALLTAAPHVQHDFVTVNADHFCDPTAYKLFLSHAAAGRFFVSAQKVTSGAHAFGVVQQDKTGRVVRVVEKPKGAEAGLIAIGTNSLPKTFLSYLKKVKKSARGEFEVNDALELFAKDHALSVVPFDGFTNGVSYFWDLLDCNEWALEHAMPHEILGTVEPGVILDRQTNATKGQDGKTRPANIHIGKGTVVRGPCRIEGPCFIGENCTIGPNSFIRKGTVVWNRCHVGSSEVKNSIVMDDSNVPHFNYVGDSVLGQDVNMGAGSITANLRFDDQKVFAFIKGQKVDSGRRKLGCVIGDGTKIGINVSITCGMLIGRNVHVYPRAFVKQNVPSGAKVTE